MLHASWNDQSYRFVPYTEAYANDDGDLDHIRLAHAHLEVALEGSELHEHLQAVLQGLCGLLGWWIAGVGWSSW